MLKQILFSVLAISAIAATQVQAECKSTSESTFIKGVHIYGYTGLIMDNPYDHDKDMPEIYPIQFDVSGFPYKDLSKPDQNDIVGNLQALSLLIDSSGWISKIISNEFYYWDGVVYFLRSTNKKLQRFGTIERDTNALNIDAIYSYNPDTSYFATRYAGADCKEEWQMSLDVSVKE